MVFLSRGVIAIAILLGHAIAEHIASHPGDGGALHAREGETSSGKPHLISTVDGATDEEFQQLIQITPLKDKKGSRVSDPDVPWVSYQYADITDEEAEEIRGNSLIVFVEPISEDDGQALAIPNHEIRSLSKRELPQSVNQRDNSQYHLGLLTARNQKNDPTKLPNYVFEPSLGKGQTIYVLDTGINLEHTEFDTSEREVRFHVVSNDFTLGSIRPVLEERRWGPEDITDINGHGTLVASIAAGSSYGVASRANLVMVKFRNAGMNPNKDPDDPDDPTARRLIPRGVTDSALEAAFTWVFGDVARERKKNQDPSQRFIINMSYGWLKEDGHLGKIKILERALLRCKSQDITIVVAAGNEGRLHNLDEYVPQEFGNDDRFEMITVGGVDREGKYYKHTVNSRGQGGEVNLYAGAVDVVGADANGKDNLASRTDTGSSLAAPAVAGLAAYFFGIPELDEKFNEGSIPHDIKTFLIENSELRNDNPFNPGDDFPASPQPATGSLKVPYNLALNGLCDLDSEAEAKRSIFEKRTLDPFSSVPGRPIVENRAVVNEDIKNELCGTHNPTVNSPAVNPPSQAFEVGARGVGGSGTWGIYQRPRGEGNEINACNPGEAVFDGPTLPLVLIDIQGRLELGPFNLPDSYTDCNFVAADASQDGEIACDQQQSIPCRRLAQNSIRTCLGEGDPFQALWLCNE